MRREADDAVAQRGTETETETEAETETGTETERVVVESPAPLPIAPRLSAIPAKTIAPVRRMSGAYSSVMVTQLPRSGFKPRAPNR